MATINQPYLAASRFDAQQGLWPHEVVIPKGTTLYRFVDSSRGPVRAIADGPWWFEYDHFQTIKHFALRHGYSFGYAARLFAAILYEWSEVDAFVAAPTLEPLSVWKGRGKQVRPTGKNVRDVTATMTPMQGALEVYQLFIPGLGRPFHKLADYFGTPMLERIATG
jgi:hypothetical protein